MNQTKKIALLALAVVIFGSCGDKSGTEKHHGTRDNIVNVHDRIVEIEMEEVFIGPVALIYLVNEYFVVTNYMSKDKLVCFFDRKTFKHVTSIINKGQGPGEMANIGHIAADEANRRFFVTDNATQKIYTYYLDSILANPKYMPEVKASTEKFLYIDKYQYINDTLCIGCAWNVYEGGNFTMFASNWNMQTEELTPMKYQHPINLKRKRITVAVSEEHGMYAECYHHNDLMTLCTLDGELICNIYGQRYNTEQSNRMSYYGLSAEFVKDKIVAIYNGKERLIHDGDKVVGSNGPTKFMIYDLNGNYIKTLETGYRIAYFCYDRDNNRIIMFFEDDIQFGYLDLDGIID